MYEEQYPQKTKNGNINEQTVATIIRNYIDTSTQSTQKKIEL